MNESVKLLVCGLPGSGKTTYLGALWHLVFAREIDTSLPYDTLPAQRSHLNNLSSKWLKCEEMPHTYIKDETQVKINFRNGEKKVTVVWPDSAGEGWDVLWEKRLCTSNLATLAEECNGILLFAHADMINFPVPVVEIAAQAKELGEKLEDNAGVPYSSNLSPTQVKLVDILQLLANSLLRPGNRRLAVILTAWDLVNGTQVTPEEFFSANFPLLDQYLKGGLDYSAYKIYGVSAQGGDLQNQALKLQSFDQPSERIKIVDGENHSHDLTLPIKWLMETSQ